MGLKINVMINKRKQLENSINKNVKKTVNFTSSKHTNERVLLKG